MSTFIRFIAAGLLVASSFSLGGCAATEDEMADDEESVLGATSEQDLTITPARQAQLDALRARVTSDFSPAALGSNKLVFVVSRYKSDESRAVLFGHIMKRDAQGRDRELTAADYKGSDFEERIKLGVFDGPEVHAYLVKKEGKWTVAKKGRSEAYVVGPTDVAFFGWPEEFGTPRAWLGL